MGGSVEEQNSGLTCLKYIVMSFNGILMMTGCFLVSIGITIYSLYHSLNTVLENRFFSPATLLFMIGCFIFIISIVGFVGVIKESTLVINTYCVLLGFICLLQISGVISAIILNGNLYGALNRTLNMTIRNYPYDTEASQAMDQIQRKLKCCGMYGPRDWEYVFPMNRLQYMFDNILLPDSCCGELLFTDTDIMCLETNMSGCLWPLTKVIRFTIKFVITTLVILAIIQLAGISFTNRLARVLIDIKSERLARQIMLTNQAQNIYDALGVVGPGTYADKPPSYDELKHTFK